MTTKTHKIVYAALIALAIGISFQGLLAILNLYQPGLFIKTAFFVWLFFLLQIPLPYDLHFKSHRGLKELKKRFAHFLEWKFLKLWLNYLILPGMLFWGSAAIFFLNFGFAKVQQIVAVFSSIAVFFNFLYMKEVFGRNKEIIDRDLFVIFTTVKIYAAALVFAAALGLAKSYCFKASLFISGIFALTFLLVYQALFQHRRVNFNNLGWTLLIAAGQSLASFVVLVFWGWNYFTAAVFLTVCFNLMWGVLHYHLDQALTWKAFWEILAVSLVVAAMIFSATNFKAKILDSCEYNLNLKF